MTDNNSVSERLVIDKVMASGSSFFWAMRLLPPERRKAIYAVYAFCRDVDDIVDEVGSEEKKRTGLALWQESIENLYAEKSPDMLLANALVRPISDFGLKKEDFIAVIDGCRMDIGAGMFRPSMTELDLYCDRVASAVGRLSVRIFGDSGEEAVKVANHQGRALQLTNILRDVAVDAAIGRLYLPDDILISHGIEGTDISVILSHPALPLVCRDLAEIAGENFHQARRLMRKCSPKAMRPARVMLELYAMIYYRSKQDGWIPRLVPRSIPKIKKIFCAIRYGLFD